MGVWGVCDLLIVRLSRARSWAGTWDTWLATFPHEGFGRWWDGWDPNAVTEPTCPG